MATKTPKTTTAPKRKTAKAVKRSKKTATPAPLCRVKTSRIHGRGVFAARDIKKGTSVIEYKGNRMSWDEALELPPSDPDNPTHTFFFELSDGRVIDGGSAGNEARWINHSCDPNCESFEDENDRVWIQAIRDIAKGEELSYDYKLSVDGKLKKKELEDYACHCGSEKCRGYLIKLKKKKKDKKKDKKGDKKKKGKKKKD
ncbi:MAG: SET domain-containing protein-lysine N-methyltransferase [Betaproteobacteria bacterium]|nr:SET domain-containing protein-lysine N-methyltransferase [Betaproteobacteria bacterium]